MDIKHRCITIVAAEEKTIATVHQVDVDVGHLNGEGVAILLLLQAALEVVGIDDEDDKILLI